MYAFVFLALLFSLCGTHGLPPQKLDHLRALTRHPLPSSFPASNVTATTTVELWPGMAMGVIVDTNTDPSPSGYVCINATSSTGKKASHCSEVLLFHWWLTQCQIGLTGDKPETWTLTARSTAKYITWELVTFQQRSKPFVMVGPNSQDSGAWSSESHFVCCGTFYTLSMPYDVTKSTVKNWQMSLSFNVSVNPNVTINEPNLLVGATGGCPAETSKPHFDYVAKMVPNKHPHTKITTFYLEVPNSYFHKHPKGELVVWVGQNYTAHQWAPTSFRWFYSLDFQ